MFIFVLIQEEKRTKLLKFPLFLHAFGMLILPSFLIYMTIYLFHGYLVHTQVNEKKAQKVIQPIVQQKEMTILHAFFESWMS